MTSWTAPRAAIAAELRRLKSGALLDGWRGVNEPVA